MWWLKPLIPVLQRPRQVDPWVEGQPVLQSSFQDSEKWNKVKKLKWKRYVTSKNYVYYEKKMIFNVIEKLDQSLQELFL